MAPSYCISAAFVVAALSHLSAALPQERKSQALNVEDEANVRLHVSPAGEMMRREDKAHAAGLAETSSVNPAEVVQDGAVTVVTPAKSSSEMNKLEELTEECMHEEPTAECMEKFGSYGIRRLYTETWSNVQKLGYRRPGWMSHPAVQKRRLFELTLPGTASSGSYAVGSEQATSTDAGAAPPVFGAVVQNFDFYNQLELGIRAFDIKVGYSTENTLVYISHGSLMIPLASVLRDMRRFLEEHEREVVILDIKKDPAADPAKLKPFTDEEAANERIPGQLVHEAVQCELKAMIATYAVLSQLPGDEMAENPTIGALTDVGAHVVYFWEGQQVLCTSFEECQRTPGWFPARGGGQGYPAFAFGPPFVLGSRTNATGGKSTIRIMEPGCQSHSDFFTSNDQPEKLMAKIKEYSKDMAGKTATNHPTCYPIGTALPNLHKPTVWYTVDAYTSNTEKELALQSERMRGVKAIYTRGEGFTVKTDAERTNYLMLSWFLKVNNQETFMKPNVFLFEFSGSAMMPIIRLIEAQQGRPECGWAVYCKDSGSCWADTLLGEKDMCIPEKIVEQKLEDHANGKEENTSWIIYATIGLVSSLFCMFFLSSVAHVRKAWKLDKPTKAEAEQPLAEDGDAGQEGEATAESAPEDDDGAGASSQAAMAGGVKNGM